MTGYSFSEYKDMKYSLSMEEMQTIHEEMLTEIGNDEDALEIYNELVAQSVQYASFRQKWAFLSKEEKMNIDESRTSCHDSLIIKFNMMERILKMQGKTAAWRDKLGRTEEDRDYRKRIGDMGCYIAFVYAVCSR